MGLSRHEVNLRRLLAKCELMVKNNQKDDERFIKYVESLEDMLQEVKKTYESSNTEIIRNYQRRITSIKIALDLTTITQLETENDAEGMRNDLLGLRQRNTTNTSTDDMDLVVQHQEELQKKITDEMLSFTKSLREQSELANRIIKKDTDVVSRSTQITETNYSKLMVESGKLAEHSKRAWKCWMWLMLLVVVVVFINMVLFMKVMKKK